MSPIVDRLYIQMSTCLTSDCRSVRPLFLSAEMLPGTHCSGRNRTGQRRVITSSSPKPSKGKTQLLPGWPVSSKQDLET